MAVMMNHDLSPDNESSTEAVSPKAERFSFFFKSDDIKSFVANTGVSHKVSKIPVVHVRELRASYPLFPKEESAMA